MRPFYLSCHRDVARLRRLIEEIAGKQGRPVHFLELASGSSDLAIALATPERKKSVLQYR